MPFSQSELHATAVILGNRKHAKYGWLQVGQPIGSGFVIGYMGETIENPPIDPTLYLVTAHHVLDGQERPQFRVTKPDGTPSAPIDIESWSQPLPKVDLAIARLPDSVMSEGVHAGLFEYMRFPVGFEQHLRLGQRVHYIGLVAPHDIPMVREGCLGNLNQPIGHDGDYEYRSHLLDCRSYGGFSGSPVFVEYGYPTLDEIPIPMPLVRQALNHTNPDWRFGNLVFVHLLIGLFVEHIDDPVDAYDYDTGEQVRLASRHGVGVVLPVDLIHAGLDSDELVAERKAAREERQRRSAE